MMNCRIAGVVCLGLMMACGCSSDADSGPDCHPYEVSPSNVPETDAGHECYPKALDWNPDDRKAKFSFHMTFENTRCPEDRDWECAEEVLIEGEPGVTCRLPAIPMNHSCYQTGESTFDEINGSEFGWYYCEHQGENFTDACSDELDNDGDGYIDCEDGECATCANCADDGIGDPELCPERCRYVIGLTDSAVELHLDAFTAGLYTSTLPDELSCCFPVEAGSPQ